MSEWQVAVGGGTTTALVTAAEAADAPVLVLAPGAGGHLRHRTVTMLSEELVRRGLTVVRFNFLYQEHRTGGPDRMPKLKECYGAVVDRVHAELQPRRLILGGHSMGGRVASMMAAEGFPCDGLLLLGYPLHPPRQPERLRSAHLPQITVPTLCVNGTRDDLCTRALMDALVAQLTASFSMHWLDGADHSYRVLKRSGRTQADVIHELGDAAARWLAHALT